MLRSPWPKRLRSVTQKCANLSFIAKLFNRRSQASIWELNQKFLNAIPRDWDDPDGWIDRALAQCRAQPWSLMVLHDLPTGAMDHLERFLDRAREAGARIRQDFPPDCVPIRSGEIVRSIEPYVSSIEEGTEE